jgi:predicted nicotinamide N-methyase
VLAKLFEYSPTFFPLQGYRVLELGAGCGLVGLALAFGDASQVVLTDVHEVLSHLHHNVEATLDQRHIFKSDTTTSPLIATQERVMVRELRWGADQISLARLQAEFPQGFHYIVASDVVWVEELVEPLVETVTALKPHLMMVLALEHRALRVETMFFAALQARGFHIGAVPWETMHPQFRSTDIDVYTVVSRKDS